LPHEGELFVIDEMPLKVGGCAANVAIDLAKQGVAVDVCGCVGDDDAADVLMHRLSLAGLGCEPIARVKTHPTSKTVILLVEGQDRRYLHSFGANAAFQVSQISREWIDGLKVFYLGGLLAMPAISPNQLAELLAYCREKNVVTVVDVVVPNDLDGLDPLRPLLPYTDYFLPNDDEAERLTGSKDVEEQVDALLDCGVDTVVITLGPDGSLAAKGGDRWKAEAYQVDSIDPSGSGDAFDAGLIAGILRGWDMSETLRFAAAMGASATTAVGTTDGIFTPEQAKAFIERNPLNVSHYTKKN
jgi:sugar/nucleoside kinase (ribokinase family)